MFVRRPSSPPWLPVLLLALLVGACTEPGGPFSPGAGDGPLPALTKPGSEEDLPPPPHARGTTHRQGTARVWLLPFQAKGNPALARELAGHFRRAAPGQPGLKGGSFLDDLPDPRNPAGGARLAQLGAQYAVTGVLDVGRGGILTLELYAPPDATPRWMTSVPVATEQEVPSAAEVILGRLIQHLESHHEFSQVSFGPGTDPKDAATRVARAELLGDSPAPEPPTRARQPAERAEREPADTPRRSTDRGTGRYTYAVQAGSFQEKSNATGHLKTLRAAGQEPYLVSYRDGNGRTWHSVRLGQFRDRDEAIRFVDTLRRRSPKANLSVVPYVAP